MSAEESKRGQPGGRSRAEQPAGSDACWSQLKPERKGRRSGNRDSKQRSTHGPPSEARHLRVHLSDGGRRRLGRGRSVGVGDGPDQESKKTRERASAVATGRRGDRRKNRADCGSWRPGASAYSSIVCVGGGLCASLPPSLPSQSAWPRYPPCRKARQAGRQHARGREETGQDSLRHTA